MSYSLITSTVKGPGENGGATDAIDTTGADLLVVECAWFDDVTANPTLSDSKSNTWTATTRRDNGSRTTRIFFCQGGTVGSGHTFTFAGTTSFPVIAAHAFSGSAASPLDLEDTASQASGTDVTPTLTPSEDNCLVITSADFGTGTSPSIDDGFTAQALGLGGGNNVGGGGAYLIQTSAAAASPTWSWTGTSQAVASIVSFKAAAAPSGNRRRRVIICGAAA